MPRRWLIKYEDFVDEFQDLFLRFSLFNFTPLSFSTRLLQPLDRPIPRNPKYEHVAPTIDTGASMSKVLQRLNDVQTSLSKSASSTSYHHHHQHHRHHQQQQQQHYDIHLRAIVQISRSSTCDLDYRYKPGEIFRRIRATTLVSLVCHSQSDHANPGENTEQLSI